MSWGGFRESFEMLGAGIAIGWALAQVMDMFRAERARRRAEREGRFL